MNILTLIIIILLVLVIAFFINKGIKEKSKKLKDMEADEKAKANKKINIITITISVIIIIAITILAFTMNRSSVVKKQDTTTLNNTKDNTSVVVSSYNAIDYLIKNKETSIKAQVQTSANFNTMSTFTISNTNIETQSYTNKNGEREIYYLVTLKGNSIGYWDEYNTKIKQVKFTVTAKVYPNGDVYGISATTEKAK